MELPSQADAIITKVMATATAMVMVMATARVMVKVPLGDNALFIF